MVIDKNTGILRYRLDIRILRYYPVSLVITQSSNDTHLSRLHSRLKKKRKLNIFYSNYPSSSLLTRSVALRVISFAPSRNFQKEMNIKLCKTPPPRLPDQAPVTGYPPRLDRIPDLNQFLFLYLSMLPVKGFR